MARVYLLLFVTFIAGCAGPVAKGALFSKHIDPPADKSKIYVYKQESGDGITVCLKLLLNEIEHGCLKGQGYLENTVEPREYTLILQTNAFMGPRLVEHHFIAKPGASYYYEFAFTSGESTNGAVDTKGIGGGIASGGAIVIFSGTHALYIREKSEALKALKTLRESE